MKYKIVRQPDEMNCGVASIAMICAYYGISNMSLAVIREFAQTDKDGNSMYSLKVAAEKLNFDVEAYEATKEDLINEDIVVPIIVHTVVDGLYQHYMVVFEINKDNVVVGDPAVGQVTMKWKDFEKIWTGEILILRPTEHFEENKKYKRNNKIIFELIFKHKKHLIELFVVSAIISAISVLTAKFYSYVVDFIIPNNDVTLLFQLLLVTMGIYIFTVAINWVKLKITIKFNRKLDKELIVNIYNRITNLPMSFFSSRTSGDLSARFEDGDSIRTIITDFTLNFVIDLVYAIVAIITICLYHSWQIAVITIFMIGVILILENFFKDKMVEQTRKIVKSDTEIHSFANATFIGSETIKSYNSEDLIENTMNQKYKKYQDVLYKNQQLSQIQDDLVSTIMQITSLFMLAILAVLVIKQKITMGELMYIYTLIDYIIEPIDYLINIQDNIYEVTAALERLDDVFRTTTEKETNMNKVNIVEKIENIEFKNVSFQYGLRDLILEDISFIIKKGESIGIIGESGSGKTTIIKLLLKFYNPTSGNILINGVDFEKLTTSSLRRRIAYVSQNDFWFKDSLFNNLTIGNRNATLEELDKVLKIVQMKDYVEKQRHGLDGMIEEGATDLSTGQRQRFSIAKALITNPDVLILDESTSNLDAKTEELIVNSLAHETDKIKIVVAHRLNTLAKCDKIISIRDGKIVEFGSPNELLKKKGMFYELWNVQKEVVNSALEVKNSS